VPSSASASANRTRWTLARASALMGVPSEESCAPGTGIFVEAEGPGVVRSVLQGLALGF